MKTSFTNGGELCQLLLLSPIRMQVYLRAFPSNIKPILTIRDGKLDLLERVRTQRKAWARAIELSVEAAASRRNERLAILHVTAESEAHEFYEQISKAIPCPVEVLYAELTPGLSVHSGAGMVGAAFVTAE